MQHRTPPLVVCVFVLTFVAAVFIPPAPAQQVQLADQLKRDLAEQGMNLTAGFGLRRAAAVCEAMRTNHQWLVELEQGRPIGDLFQARYLNMYTYSMAYHAMLETYLEDIRIKRPDFQCYDWQH